MASHGVMDRASACGASSPGFDSCDTQFFSFSREKVVRK